MQKVHNASSDRPVTLDSFDAAELEPNEVADFCDLESPGLGTSLPPLPRPCLLACASGC